MLKALFKLGSASPNVTHAALTEPDNLSMVDFLCNAASLMPFKQSEANVATSYMSARSYREGQSVMEEGRRAGPVIARRCQHANALRFAD